MILLPDEDGLPVGVQVNALIGEAMRQSVADAEPSPGFAARLAAALDDAEDGLPPAPARGAAGGGGPDEAGQGAGEVAAAS